MSEHRPIEQPLSPVEQAEGAQTILLHDESQTLVPGAVLIPKDTDRDVPFNGDILAKISLPSDSKEDPDKIIALVDFGEKDEDGKWPYLIKIDGSERPGWGRTKSRYALMGMNYVPVSHTITYAELNEGGNSFGREDNLRNYTLGVQEDQIGNKAISANHFSVDIVDGNITVSDHSTNGTTLEFPTDRRQLEQGKQKSRAKSIGKRILARARRS